VAEGAGGGGQAPGETGVPVHGEVLWRWVRHWAGFVGFPRSEAVDRLAAYPASTVAVVVEIRADASYRPSEDDHLAY
jgi:hypothetical protein